MNKSETARLEGVLAIWKPAGWTSHDVVAKARKLLGIRRIGHTGTLDPAVTGVLPLCIGRATRFVEYLQEMPKTYDVLLRFGVATDTQDLTGSVTESMDASFLSEDKIRSAVMSFLGEIQQVPPMVSAVKVNGKRLYELARQGVTVDRKPRKVTIYAIEIKEIASGIPHPEIRFSVRCSKGTYIRALCEDIGRSLGVPAVMASLVRTESAGLTQKNCVTLEDIPKLLQTGTLDEALVPADRLLAHFPRATAPAAEARSALQGKPLPAESLKPFPEQAGLWLVDREDGAFLGIFLREKRSDFLKAVKLFPPEE